MATASYNIRALTRRAFDASLTHSSSFTPVITPSASLIDCGLIYISLYCISAAELSSYLSTPTSLQGHGIFRLFFYVTLLTRVYDVAISAHGLRGSLGTTNLENVESFSPEVKHTIWNAAATLLGFGVGIAHAWSLLTELLWSGKGDWDLVTALECFKLMSWFNCLFGWFCVLVIGDVRLERMRKGE